jgi:aromatic-L-amino-acid/L-tryptophan decarboxylase
VMAVVCFSARRGSIPVPELDRLNEDIVSSVNASGEAYLTHTTLRGRTAIRLAVGNVLTTESHLLACWRLVQAVFARSAKRPE